MMDSNIENLVLQPSGRTGSSSGHPLGKGCHNGSGDSDPKPHNPTYSRRKIPLGSQMPLKKRHKPEIGGKSIKYLYEKISGANSDSELSVGSDLYKDEDDKAQLDKMSELDREMILAERSTRRGDYHFKKMVTSREKSEKGKMGSGSSSGGHMKKNSSSLLTLTAVWGSTGRTSVRRTEKLAASRSALDELRAHRMRRHDPVGFRNCLMRFAEDGFANHNRSLTLPRRHDGSSPGEYGMSGSDDEFPEVSPSHNLEPIKFEDVKDITIPRSRLLKWLMDPFFEDLMPGCFVRIAIHQHNDGTRKYRLYMVKNVDASNPDKTYKFEHYTTHKYLILVTSNKASNNKCKMAEASDSPPLEKEFQEWLQLAEDNNMRVPTHQELLEKKEAIHKAQNFVYSAATVKQLLQEKKLVSCQPVNVAAEKDRLRKELQIARARNNEAEADDILIRLGQLEQMEPKQVDPKAARLEEINRRNRAANFKNLSEAKPANTHHLKAGEAGFDPCSRRWTRPTKDYLWKPEGEGSSVADGEEDPVRAQPTKDYLWLSSNANAVVGGQEEPKGVVASATMQEEAGGGDNLKDTKAPADANESSYEMHNFELEVDLTKMLSLGSTPCQRVFNGNLLRRQRQERTIGCKVPKSDGKDHPFAISISDYKKRRGLM